MVPCLKLPFSAPESMSVTGVDENYLFFRGSLMLVSGTHSIHGTGIFTYTYNKNQPNVGEYNIPVPWMVWGRIVSQEGCPIFF